MNAEDYAEQASEIFVLSDSFIRIKELIDDESSTIDDIADVILLDPALSGTILKLANSSFFNYPGKIDTISKAVLVLGITEVYNLVIAYFSTQAFKSNQVESQFLEEFWECSVDTALMIKYIGSKLHTVNAERLFILGLLHGVGELVIKQLAPEKFKEALVISSDELPWQKQREVFGFTYADVSAELLKEWQLPFSIVEPIRYQNEEKFECSTQETKLLFIAKRMMLLNYGCSHFEQEMLISPEKLVETHVNSALIKAANEFCDMERLGILAMLKPSAAMIY
ncbi:HDOD domain-containing protein [Thalassotalea profundi]|uniref:HD family phosphohydrolase n=1 Tax=Thalassotalea profundi TaxID=2036687 RepID=A0ABQ3IZP9_9GAMM|nr:HDOD domain-containing protein [Thalassotalea profundi]GHE99415.1 HD family phosphohydrolase [Thalassotalea profundi]